MLSEEAFERAADFIVEQGRGLEGARFALEFEDGSLDDVDDELHEFQNEDGGFGHGFEPDILCPDSSPVATAAALEVLSETGAPPESDLVQGAVAYLVDTYDEQTCSWQKVPPVVNEHPHAEWWHHPDGQAASADPALWGIVNADIVAFLHDYSMLVPSDFLEEVTAEALTRLAATPDHMEMHVFAAYQRLALRLDPDRRTSVVTKLVRSAAAIVDRDPRDWGNYVASPLWVAPSPSSPLVNEVRFDLDANLDFEINRQQPDGSWRPRRRWRDYPEDWAESEVDWAGILTFRTLVQLRDFGRIQGV